MIGEQLKLYSADRRGLYQTGPLGLMLKSPFHGARFLKSHRGDFMAEDVYEHVLQMFPEGLSIHGWAYALEQNWVQNDQGEAFLRCSHAIELVFEYVRRANFPELPSRLQSYFAFDDIDRVARFSPGSPIFEVHPASMFKADQTWLNVSDQLAVASFNANQYWLGSASATPDWEYLLVPPVTIARVGVRTI